MSRIRPTHAVILLLVLLSIGGVWWAASDSSDPTIDPLTPDIENPIDTEPEGHGIVPDRHDAARLGTPVDEPVVLEKLTTVIVRVIDSNGAVIPSANVGLTNSLGRSVFSMRRPGNFHEFKDLEPGSWELMTYAVTYVDQVRTLELDGEETPLEVEVQLENALLLPVRFLTPAGDNAVEFLNSMEGSPLNGFDLYAIATKARPDSTLPPMAPGARPQYGAGLFHSVGGLFPGGSVIPYPGESYAGVLELKEPPPIFVSGVLRETVLETIEVGQSGARELTFTVIPDQLLQQLATVTLTVLDAETNSPIENLKVTCDDANIDSSSHLGSSIGADGLVTFSQRFPGWAMVRAWASGYEVFQTAVELEPGGTTNLGTIHLQKGITVTGSVTNLAGEGVRSVFYSRDDNWSSGEGPTEFGHTLGSSGRDGKLT